jgi:hypothetical protein
MSSKSNKKIKSKRPQKPTLGGSFKSVETMSPSGNMLRGTSCAPSVRRNLRVAYTQTTGSVATVTDTLLLNSGKDPMQSLSAVQPNLWDQLTAMYATYTVLAVDYRISLLVGPTATNFMFLVPNSTVALPSYSFDNLQSYPFSNGVVVKSTDTRIPVITGHFNVAKFLGYKSDDSMSDQNWALVSEDPVDQLWGLLYCANTGNTAGIWTISIELNLHCLFENPKQVVDA